MHYLQTWHMMRFCWSTVSERLLRRQNLARFCKDVIEVAVEKIGFVEILLRNDFKAYIEKLELGYTLLRR